MTTSAVIPQITFAGSSGSGTLGPFSLIKSGTPIHFTANSQIKVYRYDTTTDSAPTLLVEGTDYDLTGGPNAGSLTLTSPQTGLLTAERLFVYREQPTTQTLDLITGGNFSAANLEARLDRTTEMIQELRREVQSTVRFSLFDTDAIPGTLPLGAAIDKLVYVSGTASAPTLATINNPADLLENITLAAENITNINLVGSDLGGADTIGIVAADLDGDNTIGTVATDIANVNAVATWIGGGGIGAASVTATGSTTARTLAVRFAEVCNVRDYGATGDGSTDDTTAVQAAITAANSTSHKTVYFPAGTYKYTSQLIWNDGAVWIGDGPQKSVVKLDSTAGNIVGIRTATTSNTGNAQAVTSITSASTTATVTTSAAHGYTTGDFVNIIGATQTEYNGSFEITVTSTTTFTYTFRGSATTPATGTITCTPLAYQQSSLTLKGLHFQGFNTVLTTTPGEIHAGMLRAFSVENLLVSNCKFSDHKHILLAIGGCKNVRVEGCEFATFGREPANWNDGTLPALDGGAAWWMAANPLDNAPSQDAVFTNNYVHDGDGAVYMMGQNVRVIDNLFRNLAEGPYNRRLDVGAPSNDSERFVFAFNVVDTVTPVWVQASGVELGSKSAIIAYNTFKDCEGPGVDVSDTCEDVLVIGNQFDNCATRTTATPDGTTTITQAGAIWVRSTSYTTHVPSGIKIIGNTIRGASSNYGIRLYDTASGTFSTILVKDNDLVGSASSSANYLDYDATDFGTDVIIEDNLGADDYAVSTTWTPTISASSGTITTSSTPTARYWIDGPTVHFTITITVTDNGTGAGVLRFTLPTTPAYAGSCTGSNTANGKAIQGNWGTTTTANVNYYDGTYPVVSGHTLRISGVYMTA